jgi:hypothetical protein
LFVGNMTLYTDSWKKNISPCFYSSSCRGTLTYTRIALSHFSNVRYPSRQHYSPLSLEHTRRLWWTSVLECSISFCHGNCPFNWHSGSCDVRGNTGCLLLCVTAARYNVRYDDKVCLRNNDLLINQMELFRI